MRASERYPRFLRKSLLALLFALLLLLFTLLLLFLALLAAMVALACFNIWRKVRRRNRNQY